MDGLNMLRLHMHDYCRMHAIIKEVRGAVNIIPDLAVCQVETRAPDKAMLAGLTEAVINCAKSCAAAVNTEVSWKKFMKSFDSMLPNLAAELLAEKTMAEYGVICTKNHLPTGSTDVGNVSYRCPALQPEIDISGENIEAHTRAFAEATQKPRAHEAMRDGAKIIGRCLLEVITDEELRGRMWKSYKEEIAAAKR